MQRSGRVLLTGVCAVALALVTACGTQHATSSSPLDGPSSPPEPTAKPSFPVCPEVPGVVAPSPCASVGAEQNQQANQTFNSRIPLTASVAADAAPVTRRIQESLEKLTSAQRFQVSAVRSALLSAGMQSTDLELLGGPGTIGVTFGGYEQLNAPQDVCAWGTVTVKSVMVDTGGITREGGCLPTAGGH